MDHPEGAGRADRVDFDPRVRLEFRGTQLSSDGGLLVMRELDDATCFGCAACHSRRDPGPNRTKAARKACPTR